MMRMKFLIKSNTNKNAFKKNIYTANTKNTNDFFEKKTNFILYVPHRIFPTDNQSLSIILSKNIYNNKSKTSSEKIMSFQKKEEIKSQIEKREINQFYMENKESLSIDDKIRLIFIYNYNKSMFSMLITDLLIDLSYKIFNKLVSFKTTNEKEIFSIKDEFDEGKYLNKDFIKDLFDLLLNTKRESIGKEALFCLYYISFYSILHVENMKNDIELVLNICNWFISCAYNDFIKGDENHYKRTEENNYLFNVIEDVLVFSISFTIHNSKDSKKLLTNTCFQCVLSIIKGYFMNSYIPTRLLNVISSNFMNVIQKIDFSGKENISYKKVIEIVYIILNNKGLDLIEKSQKNTLIVNLKATIKNIISYISYISKLDNSEKVNIIDLTNIVKVLSICLYENIFSSHEIENIINSLSTILSSNLLKEIENLNKTNFNKIENKTLFNLLSLIYPLGYMNLVINTNKHHIFSQIYSKCTLLDKFYPAYKSSLFHMEVLSIMKKVLVENGFSEEIHSERKIEFIFVDLLIPSKKVCLFLNGTHHYYSNLNIIQNKEHVKYSILERKGYKVIVINRNMYLNLRESENKYEFVKDLLEEIGFYKH